MSQGIRVPAGVLAGKRDQAVTNGARDVDILFGSSESTKTHPDPLSVDTDSVSALSVTSSQIAQNAEIEQCDAEPERDNIVANTLHQTKDSFVFGNVPCAQAEIVAANPFSAEEYKNNHAETNFQRFGSASYPSFSEPGKTRYMAAVPEAPPTLNSAGLIASASGPAKSNVNRDDSGVDQYGFKKSNGAVSDAEYDAWWSRYQLYLRRRKRKWTKLLQDYGLGEYDGKPVRFPPHSERLKRYIRKGIPAEWRGNAWFWYAHGYEKLNAHPGLYKKLCAESVGLMNNDTEHIERDVYRTFPDNIYFRSDPITGKETAKVQALRRVLVAFSIYQPKIGYCQSLNFIAGNLLLFIDEEKAFWMLVIITQNFLPGLHEVNLEQVNISQGVLMISIRDRLPKVWNSLGLDDHHKDNFIASLPPISLCTASWFMSIMVNVLPTETTMRIWDCFFFEGAKIIYRVALTIFKLAEPVIAGLYDDMEVFQVLQTFPRTLINPDTLLGACFKRTNGFGHISQDDIYELHKFVSERRGQARTGDLQTTDRDEYARFRPRRRLRSRFHM